MADILCKLKLTTDEYESNLRKSKQQMRDFENSIGIAKSSVTKFLGVLGASVTVGEAFNKSIRSSQTLSDEYDRTIRGVTGTVDNLFYSIANGDWSPFLQGLANSISLAREAYNALDQLGNTKMSYGYFNMKNQAGLQDQIAILKDKNSTAEQRALAEAEAKKIIADQKEITEQLSRRSLDAMKAIVQESTGFADLDVSQMSMEKSFRLDVSAMGDEEKAKLAAKYEEFNKIAEELKKKNSTDVVMQTTFGTAIETVTDQGKLKEALKPLLSEYEDAITYNAILVKGSDDWLSSLMQINQESFVANKTLASMIKSMNRATQSGTGTSGKKKGEDKDEPVKGSIDHINAEIAKLNKKLNAATDEATRYGLRKAIEKFNKEKHLIELEATIKPLKSGELKKVKGRNAKDDIASGYIKPVAPVEVVDTKSGQLEYLESMSSIMGTIAGTTQVAGDAFASYFSAGVEGITALLPLVQSLMAVKKGEAFAGAISSAMNVPWPLSLVALAANVAAVTAAFASIPKFETGGIVGITGGIIPGASFSGDKILARVNSGELILNRAQQKNIASQLVAGGGTNRIDVNVVGRISGRDLELVMEKRNQYKARTQ